MSAAVWIELRPYAWRRLPGVALGCCAAGIALLGWRSGLSDFGVTAVSVLAALPIAFGVDEPMERVLASSPTSYRERTGLRLAVLAVAVLALWLVALVASALRGVDVEVLEPVVLTLLITAASLVATRRRPDGGAVYAVIVVTLVFLALATQGPHLEMYPVEEFRGRWLAVGAACLGVAWHATRDPVARRAG